MKYFFVILLFCCVNVVNAQEYVLPYPGPMPGNKFYTIMNIIDTFQSWWSWGSIAQTKYYLSLSDKYLVEAKILFEYKQYLLATQGLEKSNQALQNVNINIVRGYGEGKNVEQLKNITLSAYSAHIDYLEQLLMKVPHTFNWNPEKQSSVTLQIADQLKAAIDMRIRYRFDIEAFYLCTQSISSNISTKTTIAHGCWEEKEHYRSIIEAEKKTKQKIPFEVDDHEPYM